MFIVKLILVPLWPFFICSWVNKNSTKGPLGLKGWIAGLLFMYAMMIFGVMQLLEMFAGKRPNATVNPPEPEPAPSAEIAE